MDLLRSRPAAEITASDVVRRAEVSRPTLYQHFGDLPALIASAVEHRLRDLLEDTLGDAGPVPDTEAGRAGVRHLLALLREDADLFRHAAHGPSGYAVLLALAGTLAERLRSHAPWRAALTRPDCPEQLAEFLAHGAVGLVAAWLDSDFTGTDSVDAMTERLMTLLTLHFTLSGENA